MKSFAVVLVLLVSGQLAAVGLAQNTEAGADLIGVGASSVRGLYERMFEVYDQERNVRVNYSPDGSGAGRRETLAQNVDFGTSDAFLSDSQLDSVPIDPNTGEPNLILHIPVAVLNVVPAYNFAPIFETPTEVRFSGPVLADIFLGNIIRWNDPALQSLNPSVLMPDLPITVVTRADSSGTTSIFVDYLAKVSDQWARDISQGPQSSVDWPAGFGGQGSSEVAEIVEATPGAITYVSLDFAASRGLGVGVMQNSTGNFVRADAESLAEAANIPLPDDLRAAFTNTSAPGGWPIAGFTWLLLYQNQDYQGRVAARAQASLDLVRWMITDGQQFQDEFGNGRITGTTREAALQLLDTVVYGDQALR
ncbi:MAG: phosphate ABC transporter substrate-binding protein PstS [Deinococcota bacterium]